jgi:hypothetical protein
MRSCIHLKWPLLLWLAACTAQAPTDPAIPVTPSWEGTWSFVMSGDDGNMAGSCHGGGGLTFSDSMTSGIVPGEVNQHGICTREFGNRSYSLSLTTLGAASLVVADSTLTFMAGPCRYSGRVLGEPSPGMSGTGSCAVPAPAGMVHVRWSATIQSP